MSAYRLNIVWCYLQIVDNLIDLDKTKRKNSKKLTKVNSKIIKR